MKKRRICWLARPEKTKESLLAALGGGEKLANYREKQASKISSEFLCKEYIKNNKSIAIIFAKTTTSQYL